MADIPLVLEVRETKFEVVISKDKDSLPTMDLSIRVKTEDPSQEPPREAIKLNIEFPKANGGVANDTHTLEPHPTHSKFKQKLAGGAPDTVEFYLSINQSLSKTYKAGDYNFSISFLKVPEGYKAGPPVICSLEIIRRD